MSAPLLRQREAAALLNVSTSYLRRSSCPKRLLPSNTPGGRPLVRYDATELLAWDAERQIQLEKKTRLRRAS